MKTFTTLILILISTLSFSQEPLEYKFKADSSEIFNSVIEYVKFSGDFITFDSDYIIITHIEYIETIGIVAGEISIKIRDNTVSVEYLHESKKSTLTNLLKFIKANTNSDKLTKVEYDQSMIKLNLKHKQRYDDKATNTLIGTIAYNAISIIVISQLPKIATRIDNPPYATATILTLNGVINLSLITNFITKKKRANKQRHLYVIK